MDIAFEMRGVGTKLFHSKDHKKVYSQMLKRGVMTLDWSTVTF